MERAGGGLSVVLADGQSSGKGAKRISNLVVRKVIGLLAEGVRDGAAARAASDYLYHERRGKVLATLNILSIDLGTQTLVTTRNNPSPVLLAQGQEITTLAEASSPIGIYRNTRPVIHEAELRPGLCVMMFTDGLEHAGDRKGQSLPVNELFKSLLAGHAPAQEMADQFMTQALDLDDGRLVDDVSVVVLQVSDHTGDLVRRMHVRLPLGPIAAP